MKQKDAKAIRALAVFGSRAACHGSLRVPFCRTRHHTTSPSRAAVRADDTINASFAPRRVFRPASERAVHDWPPSLPGARVQARPSRAHRNNGVRCEDRGLLARRFSLLTFELV